MIPKLEYRIIHYVSEHKLMVCKKHVCASADLHAKQKMIERGKEGVIKYNIIIHALQDTEEQKQKQEGS